jgi:hypothetical protein
MTVVSMNKRICPSDFVEISRGDGGWSELGDLSRIAVVHVMDRFSLVGVISLFQLPSSMLDDDSLRNLHRKCGMCQNAPESDNSYKCTQTIDFVI